MRFLTPSILLCLASAFVAAGQSNAKASMPAQLPNGANLFIVPMEWDLDGYIRVEVRRNGLPVHLVESPEDADFIMTGSSVKLGSRLMAAGRDFQVQISEARGGTPVWTAGASDYATFFARLRSHGATRAAKTIVLKLRNRFYKPTH